MRQLPLHRLNDHGWFRPSPWLYLCMILLARTWILFIGAVASREAGADLLALFYPNKFSFYLGLALGSPALLLLWLQGLRHRFHWIGKVWRYGYGLLTSIVIIDICVQGYHIIKLHGAFSLGPAIILLLSIWALWYLLKSNSSRLVFSHQGHVDSD
ncbi:DUF2919 domain-containing protein [Ferrimonas lipolytica]|uniref:DUF2919 domain-containing protein n=1 Tax=Ferrimonas lipolytica TaxID=2724191 RepID=A0A6H1UDT3_9GAMM|nr:DUF2919 domain-containing protein [Ferrimonas lipolytica]QIZ77204.1 DUF2919 domain-containing protein [Ferrimonas lipolytica]